MVQLNHTKLKLNQFKIEMIFIFTLSLGDNCESEVDGCASRPCTEGQECTNLSSDEDEDNEKRFKCGDCPFGYRNGSSGCIGKFLFFYFLTTFSIFFYFSMMI